MILHLKSIKQVGSFRNFIGGGSITMGNITDGKKICVVLGDNTCGKSTLADIFRSANDNDSSSIIRRKTIPATSESAQEVVIKYKGVSAAREEVIKYDISGWINNKLRGRVLVFDQEFIQRNVFTGTDLTRSNKENFTDFILGEDGVELGKTIETRNTASKKFPEELRSVRPEVVRDELDEKDVDSFVKMKITKTKEELEGEIVDKQKRLARLNKASDFTRLELPEVGEETYSALLNTFTTQLTAVRDASYDDVSKEAMAQIQEQLKRTNSDWLKRGTKLVKDGRCPYCTQDTLPVQDLINAYQTVFGEKYDEYVLDVQGKIGLINSTLNRLSSTGLSGILSKNINLVKEHLPFLDEVNEAEERLDAQLEKVHTAELEIRTYISEQVQEAAYSFIEDKMINIHKKCDLDVSTGDLEKAVETADTEINVLRKLLEGYIEVIEKKRTETAAWTPEVVAKEKLETTTVIEDVALQIKRLEQDGQCEAYLAKQDEQKEYKAETTRLQAKLRTEQSVYLGKLFESINGWFKKLGSNNFELSSKTQNKGNKTVCELKVSFHGEPIGSDDLCKVFSESDRRNLALAIYLARAKQMDTENTILVLDDPVVSFDDNRIMVTCKELKQLSDQFEQVIILTHYKIVVKRLLDSQAKALYVKMEKDVNGARLAPFDTDGFALSDHEKAYLVLASFANGTSDEPGKPRPFLENHINLLFQPEIIQYGLTKFQLGEKITSLKNNGALSEDDATMLHGYREALNSDHHNDDDGTTIEDERNLTRQMLEDMYKL